MSVLHGISLNMDSVVSEDVCVVDLLKQLRRKSPRVYLLEVARLKRLVAAASEEQQAAQALVPARLHAQA